MGFSKRFEATIGQELPIAPLNLWRRPNFNRCHHRISQVSQAKGMCIFRLLGVCQVDLNAVLTRRCDLVSDHVIIHPFFHSLPYSPLL